MTVEQRLDQLEKRNKRLTVALTMTVVAMAAVVTMAATNVRDASNSENGRWVFDGGDNGTNGHLLDSRTGDMWRIYQTDKNPVTLER